MSKRVTFSQGIGGIGMSALARHLIAQGAIVPEDTTDSHLR